MRQGQKAPESASPIVMIEINLKNTRLFGFNTKSNEGNPFQGSLHQIGLKIYF